MHRQKNGDSGIEKLLELTEKFAPQSGDNIIDLSSAGVMLLCRDSDARKWAPRWLTSMGVRVTAPNDPSAALAALREENPAAIVVEAGLKASDGSPMIEAMASEPRITGDVFVLCGTSKEIARTRRLETFDVIRKPFDWELISRRVLKALERATLARRLAEQAQALEQAEVNANLAREALRSRESYEPVTGLPNRNKFKVLLSRGMRTVASDDSALAVFVVGFSRFRLVVEAMGQRHADLILAEIGQSLSDCMRAAGAEPKGRALRTSVVAKLDQARFGLMLTWSGKGDELTVLQDHLMDALSKPIQVAGQTVYLSACLGVALYPQDADDVDSLLQRSENAMREAQSRGGGFRYHCSETDAAAARKLRIEHLLHEALDNNELALAYQPIVRVSDNRIVSAEALLRWHRADEASISPTEFITVAEESGLMIRTGEFVLEQACRQMQAWQKAGVELPCLCINVAKVQLMSGSFAHLVADTLRRFDIAPASIEFELSERGVLSGDQGAIEQLHELKALGVRLSIDDFGTGDSAIAYLKDLPVDVLKIDKSYVSGVTHNRKDAAITSAMVALGQRLELLVIAEGVENQAQLTALKEIGCDAYQGFAYSRAVSAEALESLISGAPAPVSKAL